MHLVFVPPTSLYHLFLEPYLPGVGRVAGSLLSLFVSVPTLTAFLIIVASLGVYARTQGGRGLFGWLRLLPWRHPSMAAIGGRALWQPGLQRWMPWLALCGLLVFGAAGIPAGYLGVPRRVIDVGYRNEAPALWRALMAAVGVGGAVMTLALTTFAAGVAASL